jgi:PBP1b-binding outer membrane lipoprotein LpoB
MRTRRAAVLLAAPVLGLALTAGSCAPPPDPCRNVRPASPELVAAAADRPDVEIEAAGERDAECILTRDGRWVAETDS